MSEDWESECSSAPTTNNEAPTFYSQGATTCEASVGRGKWCQASAADKKPGRTVTDDFSNLRVGDTYGNSNNGYGVERDSYKRSDDSENRGFGKKYNGYNGSEGRNNYRRDDRFANSGQRGGGGGFRGDSRNDENGGGFAESNSTRRYGDRNEGRGGYGRNFSDRRDNKYSDGGDDGAENNSDRRYGDRNEGRGGYGRNFSDRRDNKYRDGGDDGAEDNSNRRYGDRNEGRGGYGRNFSDRRDNKYRDGGDDGAEDNSNRRYGDRNEGRGGYGRNFSDRRDNKYRDGGEGASEDNSNRRYGDRNEGRGSDRNDFSERRDNKWRGDADAPSGGFGQESMGSTRFHSDSGGRKEDNQNGDDVKPKPPSYVPAEKTYDTHSEIPCGINLKNLDDITVKVTGANLPPPIDSFETSGMCEELVENIRKAHYTFPLPVQKYSISIILANRDLMSCAQTGSGKTAAFLLPIIHKLKGAVDNQYNRCVEPYAVIVVPTRELADQIHSEAYKFSRNTNIRSVAVYGGTDTRYIFRQLDAGCHILIATTGRLLDILGKQKVSFRRVKYFVLDEADKMLEMGFRDDIQKIHNEMPPKHVRCTVMFSATFPEEIQKLATDYLNDYIFVSVGVLGGANKDVKQSFYRVENADKLPKLLELLNEDKDKKTLVFVEQKRTADLLASILSQKGFLTTSIHGDRFQDQREQAVADFAKGKMKVLVATSVAARGLDIIGVDHVINYDLPQLSLDYVHRIGRTGRVGNAGKATAFYTSIDNRIATDLVKILRDAEQTIPDWLQDETAGSRSSRSTGYGGSFGGRDIRSHQQNSDDRRTNVPHWECDPPDAGAPTEAESWD